MKRRIVLAVMILFFPLPARAAVIHVPADQSTIQAGIDAAVAGDTVLVADGTYTGEGNRDIELQGKAITVRSENGPEQCHLDCQGSLAEPHRGFHIHSGEGEDTVIQGFTIRGGWTFDFYGGAILCEEASPTIRQNVIGQNHARGNYPYGSGGGIGCVYATPLISGNSIRDNTAENGGGGIACFHASPIIIANTISDNQAYLGGGVQCRASSAPAISHNIFEGNSADYGGGAVYCVDQSAAAIDQNLIRGNQGGKGGGLYWYMTTHPSVTNNIIAENEADDFGGGIYCDGSMAIIAGNLIVDNEAYDSGAGITCADFAVPTIIGNTIAGNRAGNGGGLFVTSFATPFIINNTITGNYAFLYGGGIICGYDSHAEISNSILWGNEAVSGQEIYVDDWAELTVSYSDVEGGQAAAFVSQYGDLYWGSGNIEADPLFVAGPRGDYYLSQVAAGQQQDSPCVDAGSDPAAKICFTTGEETTCLDSMTTRTDLGADSGPADLGRHYSSEALTYLVAGPGPGYENEPLVRVFPARQNAAHIHEFPAYGAPHFGLNLDCGDVNGDQLDEIITGAGPGEIYGPHVRGFQVDGTSLPGLNFLAYGTNKWGVNVAASDLDNDGFDEIITGAGPGASFGPHVRGWNYDGSGSVTAMADVSFFAYGTPKWGVNVACGDIDGDGNNEIVTGAGPGAIYGPHVRGWDYDNTAIAPIAAVSFLAYGTNKYGVEVSCGDVDGDGIDEIVTGAGPGAVFGPHVRGWNYDGATLTPLSGYSFFAWETPPLSYGVNVFAGADLNGDGRDELVTGRGPDTAANSEVKVFTYDGTAVREWFSLEAYPGLTYGTNVAAGRF